MRQEEAGGEKVRLLKHRERLEELAAVAVVQALCQLAENGDLLDDLDDLGCSDDLCELVSSRGEVQVGLEHTIFVGSTRLECC